MVSLFSKAFSDIQVLLLALAALAFLSSLYFQIKNKEHLSVGFLILTALLVFSFAALLDPFLNLWDERFHALVGKNLMSHPFKPTLYDDPVVSMAYDRWDRYHIWLHKQPLFLWQIALSFKLFGISEFSLRLPDIVLSAILVFVGYRSGKLLVNPRVGYMTSVLTLSTIYLLELAAGRQEVDHNDFSFLVYVSLSIWSFAEYQHTKKRYWIYLIGAFSGLAILCKWMVGLLVYLGWFALNLQHKKFKLSLYRDLMIALLVTILIALPWQILTFIEYPAEAIQAFHLNASHFWVPVDGQRGTFWYHFDTFGIIYGSLASFLIIPSFYILYKDGRDKPLVVSFFIMVAAVYLFFSVAATKMPSFTVVVSIAVFIAFAALFDHCVQYLNRFIKNTSSRNFLFAGAVILIVLLRFNLGLLEERHSTANPNNKYSQMLTSNKAVFTSLTLPKNTVLFNVKGRHYIEAMFYTGLPAYNFMPTSEQCKNLKEKGRRIAIFKIPFIELPSYLTNDPTVILINREITGYE